MSFTAHETWTLIHGMILGTIFILSFALGFASLWSLRPELVTAEGVRERVHRMKIGVAVMAVTAWLTVITGTWIVYPWYRASGPDSPKSLLLANPATAQWHSFGMEWKEHIAWLSPILATAVAFGVFYLGSQLIRFPQVRRALMTLFAVGFLIAAVAGLFGALITKAAPLQ